MAVQLCPAPRHSSPPPPPHCHCLHRMACDDDALQLWVALDDTTPGVHRVCGFDVLQPVA